MGYSATMYQSGIPQIYENLLRIFECSKAQRQCAQSWISCINYWCERVNVSIQCSCFSEIGNSVRFLKPRRQRESSLELELENKKKKNIESEMEEGTFALGDVNNAIKLVFLIRISVRKCIVRKLEILKVKKKLGLSHWISWKIGQYYKYQIILIISTETIGAGSLSDFIRSIRLLWYCS